MPTPSLAANSNNKNEPSEREGSSKVSNYNLEGFIIKQDLGISVNSARKPQGSFANYYNKNHYSSFQNS
jgi:hypothetical protein